MKQTPATEITDRMTAMEMSIAVLEKQVALQVRQIKELLSLVASAPAAAVEDDLSPREIRLIDQMVREDLAALQRKHQRRKAA